LRRVRTAKRLRSSRAEAPFKLFTREETATFGG